MPITNRLLTDTQLSQSKAYPAAAASNNTTAIDLGQDNAFPINEQFDIVVTLPAVPNLADTKNATFTLKDSADNSSFAAIAGLSTIVQTGAGGAGAAAATKYLRLPGATRRYVRLDCAVDSAGGDSTAKSYTFALQL